MPARRVLVSPGSSGPLVLNGQTLPSAQQGVFYSANIAGRAAFGVPPYFPFSEVSNVGPDNPSVSTAGVITMTPAVARVRVTNTGAYRTTDTSTVRDVVP